jgi:hypothetical protein
MAKASRTEAPLQFRGKPGSLSAAVSDDVAVARRVPVRVALASNSKDAEKLVVRASRIEGDMVLQMTLPPRTPPGQYDGEVEVEGGTRAVVIVVEPEISRPRKRRAKIPVTIKLRATLVLRFSIIVSQSRFEIFSCL